MDYHETSPPLHPMIPTKFTLLHQVSSVAFSLSSHFTPSLLHQPQAIPQSSVYTLGAHPSHKQRLCVPCPSCGHLYVPGTCLAFHQTLCTINKQSSISRMLMPSALSFSPPSPAWTWITSLDIINAFHFGLPWLRSYHLIPYVICVEVQRVLHIPLVQLAIDPFDTIAWHAFLFFHSWCLSFSPLGGEKGHQEIHTHLHWYMVGIS